MARPAPWRWPAQARAAGRAGANDWRPTALAVSLRPTPGGGWVIALEQARAHLDQLGLTQAAEVLDSRLEIASKKQVPYADFLADLLGIEMAIRRERYLRTRTAMAHFPFQRRL